MWLCRAWRSLGREQGEHEKGAAKCCGHEQQKLLRDCLSGDCMIGVPLQGLETTVEESSGSIDKKLQESVVRINRSFDETI